MFFFHCLFSIGSFYNPGGTEKRNFFTYKSYIQIKYFLTLAELVIKMTYQEFNQKVLDYYISRSTSTFFTLSLDKQELENILSIGEIQQFHFLKTSWNCLLNTKEDIPQYFGIIAIQCYAASLMHEDDHNAADAYQVRLGELLDLEDISILQRLFKGFDITNPIQEQLWFKAKHYIESNFNLKLEIPPKRYYRERFVQYPKSQALLNTEDLKYFTLFFSEEFQVKEIISFEYFKNRLNTRFPFIYNTNRAIKLWNDEEKKSNCIKQVYDSYNLWEGEIFRPLAKKSNESKTKSISENPIAQKLILLFENKQPKFYISNTDTNEIKEVEYQNLFKIKGYKYIHTDLLIFAEMEYYPEEFEDSRFLYNSSASYIVLAPNSRKREYWYFEKSNDGKMELFSNLMLYKYSFEEGILITYLNSLVHSNKPIILKGGLKINRKREYLVGFGPSIMCDRKFDVIYRNKKCEYNPELSESGLYKIRIDSYRDLEFEIVPKPEKSLVTVQPKYKGWNLKTLFVEENFNIEGLSIKLNLVDDKKPIREWLNANIKKAKKVKYEGKNILIKAIGIYV